MVRSYWKGTLVVALSWGSLAWGQQPRWPAPANNPQEMPVLISSSEQVIPLQAPPANGYPQQAMPANGYPQQIVPAPVYQQGMPMPTNGPQQMMPVQQAPVPASAYQQVRPMPTGPQKPMPVQAQAPVAGQTVQYMTVNGQPMQVITSNGQPMQMMPASMPAGVSNGQVIVQAPAPLANGHQPEPIGPPKASNIAPNMNDKIITLQEAGKPARQARVLREMYNQDGTQVREVQLLDTGEVIRLVEGPPVTTGTASSAPHGGISALFSAFHRKAEAQPVLAQTGPSDATPAPAAATASKDKPATATDKAPAPVAQTPVSHRPPSYTALAEAKKQGATPEKTVSEKPSFWRRLFGVDEQPAEAVAKKDDKANKAVAKAPPPAIVTPSKDSTTMAGARPYKPAVEPAQPSDWRKSWGATDSTEVKKPTKPASEEIAKVKKDDKPVVKKDDKPVVKKDEKKDDKAVVKKDDKPVVKKDEKKDDKDKVKPAVAKQDDKDKVPVKPAVAEAPKPQPPAKPPTPPVTVQAKAVPESLPHADVKKPDPLVSPDLYTRNPLLSTSLPPSRGPEAPKSPLLTGGAEVKVAANTPAPAPAVEPKPKVEATAAVPAAAPGMMPGVATTQGQVPLGAKSVLAAYDGAPGQVVYMPVPMVTMPPLSQAPQAPQMMPSAPQNPDARMVNAFTPAGAANAYAMANPWMGQPYPMMGYMPMPHPMGGQMNPAALAGCCPPGPPAPMPMGMVQAGYYPQMTQGGMAQAAYSKPSCDPAAAQQLLQTLHEALYPSQREWAVEALANMDCKVHPQIVDALLASAKDDPAATVRAACVHCLPKLNISSSILTATLQSLRTDADPRVRQEAEQVLTSLGQQSQPAASKVQPASAVVPASLK